MTWLHGAICCRASVTRNPPASQSRISTSSTGLSSRASDAHWSAAAAALNPRDATTGARSVALALPSSSEDTVQCMGVVIYILLGRAGAAASTGGRDLRDVRLQLDSCVPSRNEISFCYRYDSCGLSVFVVASMMQTSRFWLLCQ